MAQRQTRRVEASGRHGEIPFQCLCWPNLAVVDSQPLCVKEQTPIKFTRKSQRLEATRKSATKELTPNSRHNEPKHQPHSPSTSKAVAEEVCRFDAAVFALNAYPDAVH